MYEICFKQKEEQKKNIIPVPCTEKSPKLRKMPEVYKNFISTVTLELEETHDQFAKYWHHMQETSCCYIVVLMLICFR